MTTSSSTPVASRPALRDYRVQDSSPLRSGRRTGAFAFWTTVTLLGLWLVVARHDSWPLHLLGAFVAAVGDIGAAGSRWHRGWASLLVAAVCLISLALHLLVFTEAF